MTDPQIEAAHRIGNVDAVADHTLLHTLTGSGRSWLELCRRAVDEGAAAAVDLLAPGSQPHRVFESLSTAQWKRAADTAEPHGDDSRSDDELLDDLATDDRPPDLSAAEAGAALARCLTGACDIADTVDTVLRHCDRAGLHSAGPQIPTLDAVPATPDDRLRELIVHLVGRGTSRSRGYAMLAALDLARGMPLERRSTTMRVLFARHASASARGEVGTLRLTLLADGPSGLHPDPRHMHFLQADDAFVDAIGAAWAVAGLDATSACVVWSLIGTDARPVNAVSGGSLAAAFAVGLDDLTPQRRSRRIRVRRLDPRCAITADLDGHHLVRVDGYDAKIEAARTAGLRVIVAEKGLPHAIAATRADGVDSVTGADTVSDAIREARTRINSRFYFTAVSVMLIVAVLGAVATTQVRNAWQRVAEQNRITHAEAQANASYAVRPRQPETGALLAAQAFLTHDSLLTRSAILSTQSDLFAGRLTGGTGPLYGVAYSPDGARIATSGYDGRLRVWDAATRKEIVTHWLGTSTSDAVAFGANGWVVSSAGGRVRVFDQRTGSEGASLDGQAGGMSNLAFAEHGRTLLTIGAVDRQVRRWDPATMAELPALPGRQGRANAVATNTAGSTIAAAGSGPVQVWLDPAASPLLLDRSWAAREVMTLAVSADGRRIAAASAVGDVTWWDLDTGTTHTSGTDGQAVWGVDFSPNGKLLAVGDDDHSVRLFDTEKQRQLTMLLHPNSVHRIAFSPDGRTLAAAGSDGTVALWNSSADSTLMHLPGESADAVAYTSDGATIASAGGDGYLHLWDAETGQETAVLPGPSHTKALSFTRDNRFVVSAGDSAGVAVLDLATRRWTTLDPGVSMNLALSSDGKLLAAAIGKRIRFWRTGTWEPVAEIGHPTGHVEALAFNPGGTTLAVGDYHNRIHLWDIRTLAAAGAQTRAPLIQSLRSGSTVRAVTFSPDGTLLAYANGEGNVFTYRTTSDGRTADTTTRTEATVLPPPGNVVMHNNLAPRPVRDLVFSNDGSRLAAAGDEGAILVWRVTNAQPRHLHVVINSHPGGVFRLAFDPTDGNRLLSAGRDGRIRRWNLDPQVVAARACAAAGRAPVINEEWRARLTELLDTDNCSTP
ncbi:hypothetical protein ACFXNW_09985 [Nocardia sp. NPDC059180]|uniref:hypothetical protein n=1 Tax=Nocardia sp. NPDC059180 TaxID=3346761 RepID=UPI0036CFEB65